MWQNNSSCSFLDFSWLTYAFSTSRYLSWWASCEEKNRLRSALFQAFKFQALHDNCIRAKLEKCSLNLCLILQPGIPHDALPNSHALWPLLLHPHSDIPDDDIYDAVCTDDNDIYEDLCALRQHLEDEGKVSLLHAERTAYSSPPLPPLVALQLLSLYPLIYLWLFFLQHALFVVALGVLCGTCLFIVLFILISFEGFMFDGIIEPSTGSLRLRVDLCECCWLSFILSIFCTCQSILQILNYLP